MIKKFLCLTFLIAFFSLIFIQYYPTKKATIRVGILHSLTGTMAFSEKPLVDVLILAIEELNQNGGLLGQTIEPIIVDGKSDWDFFAQETERLIVEEKVSVIFGCWTSACRKAIKPVVEKYQHLLFYPVQYEGMEQSPNIIYTGATPNQQISPSIQWAVENLGTKFFLVGSDYIFPRSANQIIKDLLTAQQATVVGEQYLSLGSNNVQTIIDDIEKQQPEVILNTLNGDSNIAFFQALKKINHIPVISYSIGEPELAQIGTELVSGHYAAWNYFQSIDRPENTDFIRRFKQRFGEKRLLNDPMEASYIGFNLWTQAVKSAQSTSPQRVKHVILNQSFNAPEGVVAIEPSNLHLWKTARIGQAQTNGQFKIIWQSSRPIRPVSYPFYRSKKAWRQLVETLSSTEKAL